jgi:hypothetical protein
VRLSQEDPRYVKIIACNKKYAAEIKKCVNNLRISLKAMVDLARNEDQMMKAEFEVQKWDPKNQTCSGYICWIALFLKQQFGIKDKQLERKTPS